MALHLYIFIQTIRLSNLLDTNLSHNRIRSLDYIVLSVSLITILCPTLLQQHRPDPVGQQTVILLR